MVFAKLFLKILNGILEMRKSLEKKNRFFKNKK